MRNEISHLVKIAYHLANCYVGIFKQAGDVAGSVA